jgi:N-acetylmuramoyl-L-alanine amidase
LPLFPSVALAAARSAQPEYSRVVDWAKSRALTPTWVKRDDTLLLTRGSTRITFKMDSRQADVNGVRVWLLYPVVQRDGWVRVARADVDKTLDPLVSPPRFGRVVRTVCIDAGHGGKDPGVRNGSRMEKTYTLLLARELRDQLVKQGFKVIMTRDSDTYMDLGKRTAFAAQQGADVFVSLHFNAAVEAGARTANGAEVFAMTPARAPSTGSSADSSGVGAFPGNEQDRLNILLAYEVQRGLLTGPGMADRGVQRARFAVLREAKMPAVLVEPGFMTHPLESAKIFDEGYRKRIAKGIADGLLAYKKAVDPKGK